MNFQMRAIGSVGILTGALWIGSATAAPISSAAPSNSRASFASMTQGQAPEMPRFVAPRSKDLRVSNAD